MCYTSRSVARWFIERAKKDVKQSGELLTQLKLQKLLYYAKGFSYAINNEKLFDGAIYARKYGPVVANLVGELKPFGYDPIESAFLDATKIVDKNDVALLEFVYDHVAKFSANSLVTHTHNEKPWQDTKVGSAISEDKISDYFKSIYLCDEPKNEFGISRQDILKLSYSKIVSEHKKAFLELAK